uniref:Uncharacterized protein n=1 Tax=Physcomitrium patens TaxID=3218 RepID=A0A2K1KEV5_PHYPA|nr:hypothetical protein PHYPA_008684 [Physcomitrium patens]
MGGRRKSQKCKTPLQLRCSPPPANTENTSHCTHTHTHTHTTIPKIRTQLPVERAPHHQDKPPTTNCVLAALCLQPPPPLYNIATSSLRLSAKKAQASPHFLDIRS